ncbi:hypothetical protein LTR36_007365 [Oleoguttula mirabilis]|uniref:Uncharacterized protein n=1 Tax=Oleoguttula mirabilis TaxID=1507867 RepID=A0AAV9J9T5_9PEZI|nr:hypothetical protein LTR36_007365 [Oleoguttula mirabilis]
MLYRLSIAVLADALPPNCLKPWKAKVVSMPWGYDGNHGSSKSQLSKSLYDEISCCLPLGVMTREVAEAPTANLAFLGLSSCPPSVRRMLQGRDFEEPSLFIVQVAVLVAVTAEMVVQFKYFWQLTAPICYPLRAGTYKGEAAVTQASTEIPGKVAKVVREVPAMNGNLPITD